MARLNDWQTNLSFLLEAKRNEPFSFPTHNCLMFCLDAIEAVTGNDHSIAYSGKYQTEKQAAAMLRKIDKVKTTQQLLELKLNQTLQPISFARMGDIVLTDGLDVGIQLPTDIKLFGLVPGVCYGQFSYFVGEQGLVQTETLRLGGTLWVS